MWSFDSMSFGQSWQQSSKQYKTLKEACAAAADWMEVNAANGVYCSDLIVRIAAVPKKGG